MQPPWLLGLLVRAGRRKVTRSVWEQIKWGGVMLNGLIWRFTDRDAPFFLQQITHINLLSCEAVFEIQKVLKVRHFHTANSPFFPVTTKH